MQKVLWISPYAPYDSVAHGGGKTHNFYIKYFHKSKKYDITLLSMCLPEEEAKLDLDEYGIKHHIFVLDKTRMSKLCRLLISGLAFRNPFEKYGGVCLPYERRQTQKQIKEYHKAGEKPDVIVLQWTFSLMFVEELKTMFPESKMIAIEEDVTFLNYERKRANANGRWQQCFWKKRYNLIKKKELSYLEKVDLIVTNNKKDTALLLDNGITEDKIFTSAPYIEDYLELSYNNQSKDIIFYGAMSRPENYESAIWFIENVFPHIHDVDVRFVVVGSKPHDSLCRYTDDRIIVKGFVEDVGTILSQGLCMVAPLLGGAGIKIKVLEAMSVGMPVLTNYIGIEGIDVIDGREYCHCESPEEYICAITNILEGNINIKTISENAKKYIMQNYNLSIKLDQLIERIGC